MKVFSTTHQQHAQHIDAHESVGGLIATNKNLVGTHKSAVHVSNSNKRGFTGRCVKENVATQQQKTLSQSLNNCSVRRNLIKKVKQKSCAKQLLVRNCVPLSPPAVTEAEPVNAQIWAPKRTPHSEPQKTRMSSKTPQ